MISQPLKTEHRFSDFVYWVSFALVPLMTAAVAMERLSKAWLVAYLLVLAASLALIYRVFCTHCPHYMKTGRTVRCMFMWGVPKIFAPRPGPYNPTEKVIVFAAPALAVLFPLHCLLQSPGLLFVYILSWGVFFTTIRRDECRRCVHLHCPVNPAGEDASDSEKAD